jgi:hypothetical protein
MIHGAKARFLGAIQPPTLKHWVIGSIANLNSIILNNAFWWNNFMKTITPTFWWRKMVFMIHGAKARFLGVIQTPTLKHWVIASLSNFNSIILNNSFRCNNFVRTLITPPFRWCNFEKTITLTFGWYNFGIITPAFWWHKMVFMIYGAKARFLGAIQPPTLKHWVIASISNFNSVILNNAFRCNNFMKTLTLTFGWYNFGIITPAFRSGYEANPHRGFSPIRTPKWHI